MSISTSHLPQLEQLSLTEPHFPHPHPNLHADAHSFSGDASISERSTEFIPELDKPTFEPDLRAQVGAVAHRSFGSLSVLSKRQSSGSLSILSNRQSSGSLSILSKRQSAGSISILSKRHYQTPSARLQRVQGPATDSAYSDSSLALTHGKDLANVQDKENVPGPKAPDITDVFGPSRQQFPPCEKRVSTVTASIHPVHSRHDLERTPAHSRHDLERTPVHSRHDLERTPVHSRHVLERTFGGQSKIINLTKLDMNEPLTMTLGSQGIDHSRSDLHHDDLTPPTHHRPRYPNRQHILAFISPDKTPIPRIRHVASSSSDETIGETIDHESENMSEAERTVYFEVGLLLLPPSQDTPPTFLPPGHPGGTKWTRWINAVSRGIAGRARWYRIPSPDACDSCMEMEAISWTPLGRYGNYVCVGCWITVPHNWNPTTDPLPLRTEPCGQCLLKGKTCSLKEKVGRELPLVQAKKSTKRIQVPPASRPTPTAGISRNAGGRDGTWVITSTPPTSQTPRPQTARPSPRSITQSFSQLDHTSKVLERLDQCCTATCNAYHLSPCPATYEVCASLYAMVDAIGEDHLDGLLDKMEVCIKGWHAKVKGRA